jgi:hypothetical protein
MNELAYQHTRIAYAHFTLEEWKIIARCISHTHANLYGTREALDPDKVRNILVKFPSAVL